jgi:molybdopterin molybdotransferase
VADLLTREEALARILERARPLEAEEVQTAAAAGRVLAFGAVAATDLPPFASSAMDGFALRAADTPATLAVVDRIPAGRPSRRRLAGGEAMGIATGGTVPEGADAVVPIERVGDQGSTVEVPEPAAAGQYVRERGEDVQAGDEVLPAGTRLGAAQIGALAAAGVSHVACSRRPRVAVLATGTELRPPGEPLEPGQIYESNGAMLQALFVQTGAVVERLPLAHDDSRSHREAIDRGLAADVLVTSGGVSVGPHDLVRATEHELGVEEVFWGVAVRPGKPVSFGIRGETLVFGLPGNPVSSLVGAELFVRPALRALEGDAQPGPKFELGTLVAPVKPLPGRDDLLRVLTLAESGRVDLAPIEGQGSHMIVRGAAADALALIPAGNTELPAGTSVRYLRLG